MMDVLSGAPQRGRHCCKDQTGLVNNLLCDSLNATIKMAVMTVTRTYQKAFHRGTR